jgi:(p)ppGpp synthase/HD superfamily hydrolase
MDERAIALQIARKAHDGQKDKVGEDYIKHPLTVSYYCKTERGQIAALLHDVVEDSDVTLKDLRAAGIGEDVITAVKCLTKIKDEKLTDYYNRVALNDIATEVKFADMRHNSDRSRFPKDRQKEAEENNQRYFERAKELSRIAGKERSKSLMTDETYLWFTSPIAWQQNVV